MDWQWYKFKELLENESGVYVYDEKLYKEVEILRKKNGGIYYFNLILPNGDILYKGILSNGYEVESNPSATKEDKIIKRYSRIGEYNFIRYQYHDSSHKRHIIAKVKGFKYVYYGLWLGGDEGGGFHWKTKKVGDYYLDNNIFYIKDATNDQ
ncbi:hypothetical protein CQA53_10530 [Helicobacter didelphidarum]|uniref:Uncharacterized protein n=2 Tax=Helicobacter didelphidarum TaxID=2040648 RepID=A0A3D8I8P4_9HELI|nr:hypothetical protein CQA53_10530 [Helicobacter didelphidarum]